MPLLFILSFLPFLAVILPLKKRKQQIASADALFILVPIFLLLGSLSVLFFQKSYQNKQAVLSKSLSLGKEVLVTGTAENLRLCQSGGAMELAHAVVSSYEGEEKPGNAGRLFVYTGADVILEGKVKEGSRVRIYGQAELPQTVQNPGQFDFAVYYASQGITGTVYAKDVRVCSSFFCPFSEALFRARMEIETLFLQLFGEENSAVLSSMLLGEKACLSEDIKDLYRKGGISHLLAISGLHVSLLGNIVFTVLRKLLGRNRSIWVSCAVVLVYGTFVNAGVSTKRAIVMYFLQLLALYLGRTYDTVSALSLSLVLLLLFRPMALFTAAFQLSFSAAYAASVVSGSLVAVWKKATDGESLRSVLLEKAGEILLFGMSVTLVTLPFTALHFFEFPPYGLILNPIVVPCMTLLLVSALLAGTVALVFPAGGTFLAGTARLILWLYERLCRFTQRLPYSLILIGKPRLISVGVYFIMLAWILIRAVKRAERAIEKEVKKGERTGICKLPFSAVLLLLPVLLIPAEKLFSPFTYGKRMEIHMLSVGQGDGTAILPGGAHAYLVDGGSTDVSECAEKRILPFLKAKGIRILEYAFVSHTDEDHIGGIREILTKMPVLEENTDKMSFYKGEILLKRLVLPKNDTPDDSYEALVRLAKEKKVELVFLQEGDRVTLKNGLKLLCLSPQKGEKYADKNAASCVLLATFQDFSMMFTGDISAETEEKLLCPGTVFSRALQETGGVNVLKIAHHGSKSSSSPAFLEALSPETALISCGTANRYGHPHGETIENLKKRGIASYVTKDCGEIRMIITKGRYRILPYR